MHNDTLEKAIINLISDPYDKENCFYGHIIAQCTIHVDETFDGIAGVGYRSEGFELFINPSIFSYYSLKEQKAILIHEAMHIIFNHLLRIEQKSHLRWNIATDAAINQFIEHLPKGCIYPETLKKERDQFAEYYYEAIDAQLLEQFKDATLDNHEIWRRSIKGVDESFVKEIIKDIIDKAIEKNRGYIPSSVHIALSLLNTPSQIPWQKILKRYLGNSKKYFELSYKKVNRRFPDRIDLCGKVSNYKATLVCVVDVSGSMSNEEIITGLNEIRRICELTQHKMLVIQIDTEVHEVKKRDFKDIDFIRKGSGGTNLYPAIEYIYEKHIPNDILIFISDGGFEFDTWKRIPKVPMFFLLSDGSDFTLPTKRSFLFSLD